MWLEAFSEASDNKGTEPQQLADIQESLERNNNELFSSYNEPEANENTITLTKEEYRQLAAQTDENTIRMTKEAYQQWVAQTQAYYHAEAVKEKEDLEAQIQSWGRETFPFLVYTHRKQIQWPASRAKGQRKAV